MSDHRKSRVRSYVSRRATTPLEDLRRTGTMLEKGAGSCEPRPDHFCPQCGQFPGIQKGVPKMRFLEKGRCKAEKARYSKKKSGVPDAKTGGFTNSRWKCEICAMFKLEVESNITNHLIAADSDLNVETYERLRNRSVREVQETNGEISFKDDLIFQKSL